MLARRQAPTRRHARQDSTTTLPGDANHSLEPAFPRPLSPPSNRRPSPRNPPPLTRFTFHVSRFHASPPPLVSGPPTPTRHSVPPNSPPTHMLRVAVAHPAKSKISFPTSLSDS